MHSGFAAKVTRSSHRVAASATGSQGAAASAAAAGAAGCRHIVAALQQAEYGQNKNKIKVRSLTKRGFICHSSRISGQVRRASRPHESRLQLLLPPLGWARPFCYNDAREVHCRKHHLLTRRKVSRCVGLFYLGVGSAQSWLELERRRRPQQ